MLEHKYTKFANVWSEIKEISVTCLSRSAIRRYLRLPQIYVHQHDQRVAPQPRQYKNQHGQLMTDVYFQFLIEGVVMH